MTGLDASFVHAVYAVCHGGRVAQTCFLSLPLRAVGPRKFMKMPHRLR